ncbi:MAG TPA: ATP-binding cassette domain-containing protein, partial [Deltaproteobacteria bacterium]|nr:ATP-binding cassette domain-containing protein [Deltaproteobacteria bacterium]
HGNVDNQKARNICGSMMFEGDNALKKIEVLSGGEKSRVMLAKILVTPVNVLLLDEPTNHLDMESSDALLAAIDSFEGALIMVTHNEMFLHALAERLIIFYHDAIEVFEGGYQRFLDKGGWGDEEDRIATVRRPRAADDTEGRLDKKALRKMRADIITRRSRELGPLEKRIAGVEAAIEGNETRLKTLHSEMQDASENAHGQKIVEISQAIHVCDESINSLFEELEELTVRHEKLSAEFDRQLQAIEN